MDTPRTPPADPTIIPILSVSNFVIGMGGFVIVGLLNPVAEELAMGTAEAGWIMTTYALAYAVLSPLLVSATGAIGRRRVMAAGLALFAAANAISAIAPDAATLYASRILAAAGAGVMTPVAAAVGAGLSPPERRARALAAVFFGLTLAQVLGVPAGSFIAYTFGWRMAFWVVVLLALPCLWLIWTRVPAGLSFQPVALADLRRILVDLPVMLAVTFTTTFLGALYVVYTFVAPLLSDTMDYGRDGITLALFMFGIGAVLGNLLGGMAADRFGPFRTLLCLTLVQAALMPVFSALPLPGLAVMALMLVWSTFGWSFMAGQQLRLLTLAPESASVVLALNAAAIYIGAAVGSAAGGLILSSFGLTALGIGGGIAALLAAIHLVISNRIKP
ncbi:MAG: MFS transporter [Pseudomonadota bacterium]